MSFDNDISWRYFKNFYITDLFPGDALHVTLGPVSDDGLPRAVRVEQRSPGGPVGGLRRLWGGWRGGGA